MIASRIELALILLDVQMSEIDGNALVETLRSAKETRHIPLIFVTAINSKEQHVFKGYKLGAVDYLFKPLDLNLLKSKTKVFMEFHQQKKLMKNALEIQQTVSDNLIKTAKELKTSILQLEMVSSELERINHVFQLFVPKERKFNNM